MTAKVPASKGRWEDFELLDLGLIELNQVGTTECTKVGRYKGGNRCCLLGRGRWSVASIMRSGCVGLGDRAEARHPRLLKFKLSHKPP